MSQSGRTPIWIGSSIAAIIPAWNEERAIGKVLRGLPHEMLGDVIVVDNGSTDRTSVVAASLGARVVHESRRGYGHACLAGIAALREPDVVVFLDGDYSDFPEELPDVVSPILAGRSDLVIGSRLRGRRERGSMMPQAYLGNLVVTALMRMLFGFPYTDLGPFRAIRYNRLLELAMSERTFGWTVEMQVKAVSRGLAIKEVPVRYRPRIGKSKVSGTVAGTIKAGVGILSTIARLYISEEFPRRGGVSRAV